MLATLSGDTGLLCTAWSPWKTPHKGGGENKVDDCANCFYRVYCERSFKFFQVNPCNLVLPDDADKLRQIDLITEDLRAQYDN